MDFFEVIFFFNEREFLLALYQNDFLLNQQDSFWILNDEKKNFSFCYWLFLSRSVFYNQDSSWFKENYFKRKFFKTEDDSTWKKKILFLNKKKIFFICEQIFQKINPPYLRIHYFEFRYKINAMAQSKWLPSFILRSSPSYRSVQLWCAGMHFGINEKT